MTGVSHQAQPFSNHSLFVEHNGLLSFILSSLRASFKCLTQLNPSFDYSICLLPVVIDLTRGSPSHSQRPFESQASYMHTCTSLGLESSPLLSSHSHKAGYHRSLWATELHCNMFMHMGLSQLAFRRLTDGYWILFSNSPVKSKKKLLRGSRGQKSWPLL